MVALLLTDNLEQLHHYVRGILPGGTGSSTGVSQSTPTPTNTSIPSSGGSVVTQAIRRPSAMGRRACGTGSLGRYSPQALLVRARTTP